MDSPTERPETVYRKQLPDELDVRLQAVWAKLGHLIDWCDDGTSWSRTFCSEVRPYRETFYWEAVAEIISVYLLEHPSVSPGSVLTDCLVATQCSPLADDSARVVELREAWQEILELHGQRSRRSSEPT